MEFTIILIFALIGASIGWVTNKIAIYFLFNPKEPKKFLFWTIQGVFPKRQSAIAQRFSEIFVQEFFTSEMIQKELFSPKNLSSIYNVIDENLDTFVESSLKSKYPIVALFLKESHVAQVKHEVLQLVAVKIADLTANFESHLVEIIDIQEVIQCKINELDSDDVNKVMQKIMDKELRFIELSGAILGGIIGFIQGLIAILLN